MNFLSHLIIAFTVIKPDLLPGPADGSSGSAVREGILNTTFPSALNWAIGVLGIITFIGILIAAVGMLTSYGNEDSMNRAKTNLRYGITGFVVVILSYAIVSIVVSIALPRQSMVPLAYADDPTDNINLLLPSAEEIIGQHDPRVSLPSGDALTEVIPAVVTNILYAIAFLIVIALTYGGAMLVISRGNEEYRDKAKNILVSGALALAMVVLGYAVIYGIATINFEQDPNNANDQVFPDALPN